MDERRRPDHTDPATARASRVFALLVAGYLVVAGLAQFDLRTSEAWGVALHWAAVMACGVGAFLAWRAYGRSGLGKRRPGFHGIGIAAVATTVGGGLTVCALLLAVPCHAYEVERYLRALALNLTVYLVANAAVVFLLIALLYLVLARLAASVVLGVAFVVLLHAIHVSKYLVLQQHLYAWDYQLVGDLWEILPRTLGTGGFLATALVVGGVIVLTGVLVWRGRTVERLGARGRLVGLALLAVGGLYGLLTIGADAREETPERFFPLWNRHSYHSHYNQAGLGLGLLKGTRYLWLNRAPDGYSAEAMDVIARRYPRAPEDVTPTADVILYMLESLEDLSEYDLAYQEDPLPNFRALAKAGTRGRLVVPVYGGSTSNTEFEVLTGLSRIQPWPHDMAHAYRQWITDDTPSLAWVFREWGYHTAVISGATGRYFAQRAAYPRLGFHEFRALGDRKGLPRKFDLVSDEAVVDEVIALLEDRGQAGQSCFLSVTTDMTHGPYHVDDAAEVERFALTNADLPDDVRSYATHYGAALHHADLALGRLVAFLKQRARPTILMVYGDHKPSMRPLFDAGVFRAEWPGFVLDKFSTPIAIWSNVAPPAPSISDPLLLSANFLAIELFDRLGVRHPPSTFHFTRAVYDELSVVSKVIRDRAGNVLRQHELSLEQAALLRDYGFVKYHTLVGGR